MNDSEFVMNNELEKTHWWFKGRRAVLRKVLDSLALGADVRILEAGCGTGGNLPMLSEFGLVDAMEYNPLALQFASHNHPSISILKGELPHDIPYEDESYDLICAFDVLEHVQDDRMAVKALAEKLKPGGIMLCTAPANQWMWSAHDTINHHCRRYSISSFKGLFADNALSVSYATYFNFFLFPIAALVRVCGSSQDTNESDLNESSPVVNGLLTRLFSMEQYLLPKVRLPFGVSVLCLAQRPLT